MGGNFLVLERVGLLKRYISAADGGPERGLQAGGNRTEIAMSYAVCEDIGDLIAMWVVEVMVVVVVVILVMVVLVEVVVMVVFEVMVVVIV